MNKYILLFAIAIAGIFSSCDYNDKFDGLDELSKPSNVSSYEDIITDTDIAIIVKALNANKNANDSIIAKTLSKDKAFSAKADPYLLIPYLLKDKHYGADEKSTSKVTYQYKVDNRKEQRTSQFLRTETKWVFDPTFIEVLQKGKGDTDGYMMIVNYVMAHQAIENPALINKYRDTEYYYGFSGNNGNVSYRDKDRSFDPAYPSSGSIEEKVAFMDQRTIEGVALYLTLKHPDATAKVGDMDQKAKVTLMIFSNPASTKTSEDWEYTMQCTGDKQWKFIERKAL